MGEQGKGVGKRKDSTQYSRITVGGGGGISAAIAKVLLASSAISLAVKGLMGSIGCGSSTTSSFTFGGMRQTGLYIITVQPIILTSLETQSCKAR